MNEITVDKALRLKNKIVSKLSDLDTKIATNNSVIKGCTRKHDVKALDIDRKNLQKYLIDLKFELYKSNIPIQALIFEAAELKGYLLKLSTLNTTEGIQLTAYTPVGTQPAEYTSIITYDDVQKRLKTIQKRIEDIQDALHYHNQTTKISIDEGCLKLLE